MSISRITTGYEQLDKNLRGGFPKGSVICIRGDPDVPKDQIGLKFIEDSDNNNLALLITTKYTCSQIMEIADNSKISISKSVVLDAAHWRVKRVNPKISTNADYQVDNLSDLNALLSTIIQMYKKNNNITRIFFHTPSSLLLYSTPSEEQVFKFFEMLTSFTRTNNITMSFLLENKIHDESTIETLKFLSDGSLNISKGNSLTATIEFMILTEIVEREVPIPR